MELRNVVAIAAAVFAAVSGSLNAQDCLEPMSRWSYGVSNGVAADGGLALLANGAVLQVVDLTDPSTPTVLDELRLPRRIEGVALSGDRGYVLTYNTLYVVDLSTPSSTSRLGVLSGLLAVGGLDVVGNLVFVEGNHTLYVVDVTTPTAPVLSGELEWTNVSIRDLAAVSDHVFLTMGVDGLRVVDVSDPTTPSEIAMVDLGVDNYAGYLDVVDDQAYVSGWGAFYDDKIFVIDVTDPAHPVLDADAVIVAGGGDILFRDGFVHIFGGDPGALQIYDVTVPQTPVWQGSATIPSNYQERLAAIDGHILATTYLRGLTVVETTDPTDPAPVGGLDALGRIHDAATADGVLFIVTEELGLRMVDVDDPAQPVELGSSTVVQSPYAISIRGDLAYVAASPEGLAVLDISNPPALQVLGNAPGVGGDWIAVAGDYAYLFWPTFGLFVLDVSSPSNPVHVGTLDLPQGSGESWEWPVVSGNHLFARNNHNDPWIAIVDVSDPTTPTLAGSIDVSANIGGLAGMGSWLLVPDIGSQPLVRIFDVGNPAAPVEHAPYVPVGGYATVVAVAGSVAYLPIWDGLYPDYSFAVEAVNFADPGAPEYLGLSHVTGWVSRLLTSSGEVFSLTVETGFDTLALCHNPVFADGFESGDTSAWGSAVP